MLEGGLHDEKKHRVLLEICQEAKEARVALVVVGTASIPVIRTVVKAETISIP